MISCIVLAAGESARFGSPKALAKIGSTTVIQKIQTELLDSKIDEIIIVLGAWSDQIKPFLLDHKAVNIVYNKDYKLGQTSSFQAGLRRISKDSKGIMLLPVDYPFINKNVINKVCRQFIHQKYSKIIIPSFEGKKGHPPVFPIFFKDEFLALDKNEGINIIAIRHQEEAITFSVKNSSVIKTFNTQEEFNQILKDQ